MRLVMLCSGELETLGVLSNDQTRVLDVRRVDGTLPTSCHDVIEQGSEVLERLRRVCDGAAESHWQPLDGKRLSPPLRRPGKIMAIGLNYRAHAEEQDRQPPTTPVLFAKFPTAIIGPHEPIVIPRASTSIDYEAELAVVIGRRARNLQPAQAADYVFGYTLVNDVTARDLQRSDRQWVRAKSFDTFCPMGPQIVTVDELEFPPARPIRCRVNGEERQSSVTSDMIFDIPTLMAFLSDAFTLEPGDVICTGTPSGVGVFRKPPVFLKDGDVVEVEVEGVGLLRNPVRG